MIEINLIPDVKQELIKAQRVRSKVITGAIFISLASIGVVAALLAYIFMVQGVRGALLDARIDEGNKKLSSVEDLTKVLTIQNQLTKISDLNGNKKVSSRLFNLLNAVIPPSPNQIKISELTVDTTTNIVKIDGQARNSYMAVEIFKKTIDGAELIYKDESGSEQKIKIASGISTSNTSYGEDSSGEKVLRFTLSFAYDPMLFSSKIESSKIALANKGNVTDSYLGVPKSIFEEKAEDIEE